MGAGLMPGTFGKYNHQTIAAGTVEKAQRKA